MSAETPTGRALAAGFTLKGSYWAFDFGDGYELTFEPTVSDVDPLTFGNFDVALYRAGFLLIPKVPVRPDDGPR